MNRSPAAGPPDVEAWRRPARAAARRRLRHAEIVVTTITDLRRQKTSPYDIAVALSPGADPALSAKAGATWWPADLPPETVSLDRMRGVLREGPDRALRDRHPHDRPTCRIGIERIR